MANCHKCRLATHTHTLVGYWRAYPSVATTKHPHQRRRGVVGAWSVEDRQCVPGSDAKHTSVFCFFWWLVGLINVGWPILNYLLFFFNLLHTARLRPGAGGVEDRIKKKVVWAVKKTRDAHPPLPPPSGADVWGAKKTNHHHPTTPTPQRKCGSPTRGEKKKKKKKRPFFLLLRPFSLIKKKKHRSHV